MEKQLVLSLCLLGLLLLPYFLLDNILYEEVEGCVVAVCYITAIQHIHLTVILKICMYFFFHRKMSVRASSVCALYGMELLYN